MKTFVVSDKESLLKLTSDNKLKDTQKIKLEISQLDTNENAIYEKKINRWFYACGCESGAIFCSVAMIIYSIFSLFNTHTWTWSLVKNGIVILFLSGLAGKLVGLFLARLQLNTTIKDLSNKLY